MNEEPERLRDGKAFEATPDGGDVCASLAYPREPSGEERKAQIEAMCEEEGIVVAWAKEFWGPG